MKPLRKYEMTSTLPEPEELWIGDATGSAAAKSSVRSYPQITQSESTKMRF